MSRFDIVCIPGVILKRSTPKAGLYRDEDGNEFWIPFSQLKSDPESDQESVDRDGEFGDIFIPLWLAEEKDLEYIEFETEEEEED